MPIKLGLVGHPVSHSLSPLLHGAALTYFGWGGEYVLIDCLQDDLEALLKRLSGDGWSGLNVTIPHKQAVIPYLASLTAEARRLGAVNTIRFEEAETATARGHNTDLGGLLHALNYHGMEEHAKGSVCILGAGGAARAALWALDSLGARSIHVVARRPQRAHDLIAAVKETQGWKTNAACIDWQKAAIESYDLLINCTPLGLSADETDLPHWALMVLVGRGRAGCAVYDMVYGKSLFADAAKIEGLLFADGQEMLIGQAALSFEYWTGAAVPLEIMRASLVKKRECI